MHAHLVIEYVLENIIEITTDLILKDPWINIDSTLLSNSRLDVDIRNYNNWASTNIEYALSCLINIHGQQLFRAIDINIHTCLHLCVCEHWRLKIFFLKISCAGTSRWAVMFPYYLIRHGATDLNLGVDDFRVILVKGSIMYYLGIKMMTYQ